MTRLWEEVRDISTFYISEWSHWLDRSARLRGRRVLSHDMFRRPVLTSLSTWRQELWQHVEIFSRSRDVGSSRRLFKASAHSEGGNLEEGGKRSHLWSPISVTADCSIETTSARSEKTMRGEELRRRTGVWCLLQVNLMSSLLHLPLRRTYPNFQYGPILSLKWK